MAVTATFRADFTQFQAAVSRAETKLRGFQSGAAGVEKALGRMADSFSGRKVLQEAELAAKAVNDLGGVAKLTENEQRRLNATVSEALDKYKALGLEAPKELTELEEATRKVDDATTQAASATDIFKEKWAQFTVAAGAAVIGINKAVDAIGGLVRASSEQEDATVRLQGALMAQGEFTPQLAQQYAELASQFQKTTVFSDELITEMEALFIQVGNVGPTQMEAALKAATDLSAGLGIDLRTATMAVAKAFEGGGTSLTKMLPSLKELIKEGATTEEVLAALNERFGGQAQNQIQTFSGKMKVLNNQVGEVRERAGDLVAKAMIPLLEAFTSLPESAQTTIAAIGVMATVVGPLGLAFAGVASTISLLLPVLSTALPAAFSALLPFIGPGAAVVAGITAIYLAWKNWDAIVGFVKGVYEGVRDWLGAKLQAVFDAVKAKVDAVVGAFKYMFDAVVGNSYVPDMVDGIEYEFGRLESAMVQPTMKAASGVAGIFQGLAQSIPSLLGNIFSGSGISGALSSILGGGPSGGLLGAGLTKGLQSAFNATSGTLLNIFGGGLSTALGMALPGIGAALGPLLTKGLGKLWDGLKGIFGGPSEEELQGRAVVDEFRAAVEELFPLIEDRVPKGLDMWAQAGALVQQAFIGMGLSAEDAAARAQVELQRLYDSTGKGADATRAVFDRLMDVIKDGLGGALKDTAKTGKMSFEEVQNAITDLRDKAILSQDQGLIAAVDELQLSMTTAAESGVMDFTFMTAEIMKLKEQIGKAIVIPISTSGSFRPPSPGGSLSGSGGSVVGENWQLDGRSLEQARSDFLRSNPGDEHRFDQAIRDVHRIEEALTNIPGMHSGGFVGWPKAHAGLAVDERPYILQTGEGVLSRKGMAALEMLNKGSWNGGNYSREVVTDPHNDDGVEDMKRMYRDLPRALKVAVRDAMVQAGRAA